MLDTPRQQSDETDGLHRLKSLLFRGEADRLNAVEARVERIDERVGDLPRLETSTAEILVEALRRAEVARHRDLAEAIAPIVVASIRNEIKNSREAMVEALYPITGQMVIAAVTNALRELMATLNERLEKATSFDRWKLQLRSRLTGRPMAELAMSQQRGARLLRVLFLERGSGQLLASWRADGLTEDRGELIGGLLAALTSFAREALGETGELRTLDFAGRNIYVHASPAHLIASEVSLPLRAGQKADLDRECLAWLTQYVRTGVADDATFADFIENARANSLVKKPKGAGLPLKVLAACIALGVLGYAGRSALRAWRDHTIASAFQHILDERPTLAAYPIRIETDHSASQIAIRGLAPTAQDIDALKSGIADAAGPYTIATNVGIVATDALVADQSAKSASTIAGLDASLKSLTTRLVEASSKLDALAVRVGNLDGLAARVADLDALAARVGDLDARAANAQDVAGLTQSVEVLPTLRLDQARLSASMQSATANLSDLESRLTQLQAKLETPRARLATLIGDFSVFFDRDQPIDEPGLTDRLESLSAFLRESRQGLRIVGYSDDSGTPAANLTISRRRAELVADMLAAKGVDRALLSIVGRAAADPIVDSAGAARARNRRVSFELPFNGEIQP